VRVILKDTYVSFILYLIEVHIFFQLQAFTVLIAFMAGNLCNFFSVDLFSFPFLLLPLLFYENCSRPDRFMWQRCLAPTCHRLPLQATHNSQLITPPKCCLNSIKSLAQFAVAWKFCLSRSRNVGTQDSLHAPADDTLLPNPIAIAGNRNAGVLLQF